MTETGAGGLDFLNFIFDIIVLYMTIKKKADFSKVAIVSKLQPIHKIIFTAGFNNNIHCYSPYSSIDNRRSYFANIDNRKMQRQKNSIEYK